MFQEETSQSNSLIVPNFRPELAFPKLTEDQIERLRGYGVEESLPPNRLLFTHGARGTDMFVVLDGAITISLPVFGGETKIIAQYGRYDFTGELNLLNSQGSLGEAKTICRCLVLRIPRLQFQDLMRAEGEIANVITSAAIWRRVGILTQISSGVEVRGNAEDPAMRLIQSFLIRNNYPHRIVTVVEDDAALLCPQSANASQRFPSVTLTDGRILHRPRIAELADELGITERPDSAMIYDVAIVGAGPAGLAAAVYAASEGLCTIVVESTAPGGQAGASSKIENYLGFPTGVSGLHLAMRAHLQALKFGVKFAISREVVATEQADGIHVLTLAGGIPLRARSVVVASGAQYRQLAVPNYTRFENQGVYYAATAMESLLCRDKQVVVVGGGNSAGQAALFLSGVAKHVHLVVRGKSLATSMSQYLVSRIESSSRITLCTETEIVMLEGEKSLEWVSWKNQRTGETDREPIRSVFVMIGAEPNSGWLFGSVKLDRKGFILTGGSDAFSRSPYATNVHGMFAVGDVRSDSLKRIASAAGEGSVVISDVHRYLADRTTLGAAKSYSEIATLQAARTSMSQ